MQDGEVVENQNFAMYHRPTLLERIARRLGFTFRMGDEPEGVDDYPGWARTELRIGLSFLDRLRLLVSGRLDISMTHYADVRFNEMKNRTDLRLPAPWSD